MTAMKSIRLASATLAACALLAACGGGGGGSATTSTGTFVDAAVEGLSYTTDSQSGMTNAQGEFKFRANEPVTFRVGNIYIPSFVPKAGGEFTPMDVFGVLDQNDRRVVNLLVLLQSLDEDGNPNNGIKIPAGAAAAALSNIDFDVSYAVFVATPAVTNLIANSGSVTTTPVTEAAAKLHFQNVLTGSNGATKINYAPRAAAGTAQTVRQRATVTLNGTSSDANNDTVTYSWSISNKPAGSSATLIQANTATPRFVADEAGEYSLSLVVNDGTLSSAESSVTVTATAVPMVVPVALNAQGTMPTIGAGNCADVQAASNAVPTIVGADMQQVNDTLAAVDPVSYAIFKKLPDTFMWWLRGGVGATTVKMSNLTTAAHETSHSIQNVNSMQCGVSNYKYLLDGTVYTTGLTSGTTAPYSIVSEAYPAITLPNRYSTYIAATPFSAGNDARILLDELTAYATAARLGINLMNTPEYGNFTVHQDGDLAGMADFMLFVQSYLKAANLGYSGTYQALGNTDTKAYIQALWTFAELTLEQSIPYALSASSPSYVAGKPMYVNSDVLAQIYSPDMLAVLDSFGITHKTAADWQGTLLP